MSDVVAHAGEVSPEWLTRVLRQSGKLKSSVIGVRHETVGAGVGLMAELARLDIDYAEPEALPATMIAKCAARNENRGVAQLLDFYNRETNFYNRLAATCPFRVPDSYYGAVDQESYDFVLLMEDLGDVSPNDQIVGSTEAEAFDKIEKIAKLHARYWDKVKAPEYEWMYDVMSPEEATKLRNLVYVPSLEPAIQNFAAHFSDESRRVCREVGERYVELLSQVSPAYTFIHGDYRQDNFIYQGGGGDAVIMDWQISGTGFGVFDVTYFICQSLQVDLRREIEMPLLELYVARLKEYGVPDYEFTNAWRDYRLLILFCLIYPITVCGGLDLGNERGRALAECMLERNLAAVEDLDCAELLASAS